MSEQKHPSRQRRDRHMHVSFKLILLKKWHKVVTFWNELRPRPSVVRLRIFQAQTSNNNGREIIVNEKHHDRTPLDQVSALQSVSTVSPLNLGLAKLRSSGPSVNPSPQTNTLAAAEQKERHDLANLIKTRLINVHPDDQDLELEDEDWTRICAAITEGQS